MSKTLIRTNYAIKGQKIPNFTKNGKIEFNAES